MRQWFPFCLGVPLSTSNHKACRIRYKILDFMSSSQDNTSSNERSSSLEDHDLLFSLLLLLRISVSSPTNNLSFENSAHVGPLSKLSFIILVVLYSNTKTEAIATATSWFEQF